VTRCEKGKNAGQTGSAGGRSRIAADPARTPLTDIAPEAVPKDKCVLKAVALKGNLREQRRSAPPWACCRILQRPVNKMKHRFLCGLLALAASLALSPPAAARSQGFTYPKSFRTGEIATNGTRLHVRIGGSGPAVVLLHGYGETGDMWVPLAKELMRDHTVIIPDLRGMGFSAKPEGGYDKKTQGGDVAGVLDALKIERADVVAHDIGNMVAFAFAAEHRKRVTRLVLIDAPLPGVGPWEEILKNPLLWHFRFGGPDMERLVAGRERIYLDRFWNEFSANPARFTEAARRHYAKLYARPGAMHAGFAQFAAFDQDATDNKAFLAAGKLDAPVLALGGEKSFGLTMAAVMRFAANDVEEGVVPDSGHWIMEENPKATVTLVRNFLDKGK